MTMNEDEPLDAIGRVRLYIGLNADLEASDLGELYLDTRFKSADWPRRMYRLRREDVEALLAEHEVLARENESLRRKLKEWEKDDATDL